MLSARPQSAQQQTRAAPAEGPPFLTVAVSSQALFDLDAADIVFRRDGPERYRCYQIRREDEVLAPGPGFAFARKLLAINERLGARRVDIILLSRNSSDTGLRVFNSIDAHGLDIVRAAFSSGSTPYRYAEAFGCDLFLSTNGDDVADALASGMAAATLLASDRTSGRQAAPANAEDEDLRIAFDGDAVLFDDQAERVFQERGLEAFQEAEEADADKPLAGGPFKPFLAGLHRLQREFHGKPCPIRTALVTARGAPAHKRVIKTLRAWGVRLDESLFLGGLDKAAFLRAYGADMFFDDQRGNCEDARSHVTTGHVPHGVTNENANAKAPVPSKP